MMTLDYNENFRWVAARLNTYIAIAWGHILGGAKDSPEEFLKAYLSYCAFSDGNMIVAKNSKERDEVWKILHFYSGFFNDDDCYSPFKEDNWRLWAFRLISSTPGANFGCPSNMVNPSTLLEKYVECKNKFRELGVI